MGIHSEELPSDFGGTSKLFLHLLLSIISDLLVHMPDILCFKSRIWLQRYLSFCSMDITVYRISYCRWTAMGFPNKKISAIEIE